MKIPDSELENYITKLHSALTNVFQEIEQSINKDPRLNDKIVPYRYHKFDIANMYSPYNITHEYFIKEKMAFMDYGISVSVTLQYNSFDYEPNKKVLSKNESGIIHLMYDISKSVDNDFKSKLNVYEIKTIESPEQLSTVLIDEICQFFSSYAGQIRQTLYEILLELEERGK